MLYRSELQYMREIEPASVESWIRATDRNLELWTSNFDRAFVVEVDGVTAAIALWAVTGEGVATLITIHVLDAFRRRGLAGLLLETTVEDARAAGLSTMELGVQRDNPARRLYESHGFVPTHDDAAYAYFARRL